MGCGGHSTCARSSERPPDGVTAAVAHVGDAEAEVITARFHVERWGTGPEVAIAFVDVLGKRSEG